MVCAMVVAVVVVAALLGGSHVSLAADSIPAYRLAHVATSHRVYGEFAMKAIKCKISLCDEIRL